MKSYSRIDILELHFFFAEFTVLKGIHSCFVCLRFNFLYAAAKLWTSQQCVLWNPTPTLNCVFGTDFIFWPKNSVVMRDWAIGTLPRAWCYALIFSTVELWPKELRFAKKCILVWERRRPFMVAQMPPGLSISTLTFLVFYSPTLKRFKC